MPSRGHAYRATTGGFRVKSPVAVGAPCLGSHPRLSSIFCRLIPGDRSAMAIVVNKPLPEFEANATGGIKVSNVSHQGLILYFYPKDNTPGCTTGPYNSVTSSRTLKNRCRGIWRVARQHGEVARRLRRSWSCPFGLIADTEEKMCHMFGAWSRTRSCTARRSRELERSTFPHQSRGASWCRNGAA